MPSVAKILALMERNPAGTSFSDLCRVIEALGYSLARTKGSHHIYTAPNLPFINLQKDGAKAKGYQVRQVLDIIAAHKLTLPE